MDGKAEITERGPEPSAGSGLRARGLRAQGLGLPALPSLPLAPLMKILRAAMKFTLITLVRNMLIGGS